MLIFNISSGYRVHLTFRDNFAINEIIKLFD